MVAESPTFAEATLTGASLACERGYQTLFEGLDFSLSSGYALQIAGANGVGKTSLLRIIATLGVPLSGKVQWNHAAVTTRLAEYRSAISYLGHKQGLKPDLTPTENLFFATRIAGHTHQLKSAMSELLAQFQIEASEDRPIRQLSAGQQQRVALARMLLAQAPIWLMDEPATSLDQQAVAQLSDLMNAQLERNGMIIFTSHQPFAIHPDRLLTLTLNRAEYD